MTYYSRHYEELSEVDKASCNTRSYQNKTQLFVRVKFGYVPETLTINLVVFLVLVLLFALFRKRAWNYGRLALVQKTESRWTQLFYSEVHTPADSTGLLCPHDSLDSVDMVVRVDNGFFSWLTATFRMKDHHIFKKCGPDAVQYLSFQRYLIVYLTIITVICLVIVLPVNYCLGSLEGKNTTFGHTTISNIEPKSKLMWIHVILSFLFLPLGVALMRHFSVNLKYQEETIVSRTIMITHVPKHKCSRKLIIKHYREMYPDCIVQDIQFAYELGNLILEDDMRMSARESRHWCERYLSETGKRIEMQTLPCNWLFCCCNCKICKKVDAIEYYTKQEEEYEKNVEKKREHALKSPLGIAFVTFETEGMAKRILKDHKDSYYYQCCHNQPSSSLTREMDALAWGLYKAPPPEDIYWENLNSDTDNWYLRAGLINTLLFLLLFFLTTPTIILNTLSMPLNQVMDFLEVPAAFTEMAAPMVLLLISVILPALVSFSDKYLYHWTRSSENLARMRKIFILLIFMVIILPSLGLVSAKSLFELLLTNKNATSATTMRWKCVFLPDNGAFFVNYVINSAFMGNAAELIRGLDLFLYVYYSLWAKSRAEQDKVQKSILWDFRFGVHYAWILLHAAITIIYSLPNPLVAPCGLVYMCIKHVIDRYNIYFVYAPSKINKQIHVTAINFLIFSIILLQIVILFFVFIRSGSAENIDEATTMFWFCVGGCVVCSVLYIAHVFFKCFKFIGPISLKGIPQTVIVDESQPFQSLQSPWSETEQPLPAPQLPKFFPSVLHVRNTPSSTEVYSLQRPPQRDYGSRSIGDTSPKHPQSTKHEAADASPRKPESSRAGVPAASKPNEAPDGSAVRSSTTTESFKVKPSSHHQRLD